MPVSATMQGNVPSQNNPPAPQFQRVVAANEGVQASVVAGSTASFTFDIPPGQWIGASIRLYALSAGFPGVSTYYESENLNHGEVFGKMSASFGASAAETDLLATCHAPAGDSTFTVDGYAVSGGAVQFGPSGGLFGAINGGQLGGVTFYVGQPAAVNPVGVACPTPGQRVLPLTDLPSTATASLTVDPPPSSAPGEQPVPGNSADTTLNQVGALLFLLAVASVPPAVLVTASGGISGTYPNLTYSGTATASVVPSGVVAADPFGGGEPPAFPAVGTAWTDGVGPYSYEWTGFEGVTLEGQGTDTVSWSFAGDVTFYLFPVSCTVTNGPLPQEPGTATYPYPQVPVPGQASEVLTTPRGATTTSVSVPFTYQAPSAPPVLATVFLTADAHRRPLAAGAGNGAPATGYFSNDAGHSFAASVIDADATSADLSLLLNRHTSRYAAFYTKGKPGSEALCAAFGPVVDGFAPDVVPAAAAGVRGLFPIACEHPTERGAALLLVVQSGGTPATGASGSLVCAETGDYGENWTQAGTVAAGVDFSASGRAGLCFVGNTAFAVYASGQGLACAKSVDRGRTWTPCASAASGSYSGLSLLGWQGTLYLLAFAAPTTAGDAPTPTLFVSETLGEAWTVSASPLPPIAIPSALGVMPETSQIRLGLTHHSDDDTAAWLAD